MINDWDSLTIDRLKVLEPREIIDSGFCEGGRSGLGVHSRAGDVHWVAIVGFNHDWAVYVGPIDWSVSQVARSGDKIYGINNIKKVVPCDDEAAGRYRR